MTDDAARRRLRQSFDEVPEGYERARPTYPAELFDDLVELAALREGDRVLEIGCGTGQATLPLARRGFRVLCVELGEGLAAVARRKLAGFPGVEVVNAQFESWEPGEARFEAVTAFTAFHWIDPDVRFEKAARLLRPGVTLAVADTQHVLDEGGDDFFVHVQEDYDAVTPSDDNRPPGPPDDIGDLTVEIEASGFFRPLATRRYLWDVTYTADEYVAVLATYSGHRALDDDTRRRLLERIHRRAAARPGGRVRKTYLATLTLARPL